MTAAVPASARRRALPLAALAALGLALVLGLGGCASLGGQARRETRLTEAVTIPGRFISNFFLIETTQADGRTYRFMVDTGSSANIVSAALADAIGRRRKQWTPRRVQGAHGTTTELEPVTLRELRLGGATFTTVPALIYDFTELSAHLGVTLDGVIGFPLFRDTLLTLDYPGARLVVAPYPAGTAPLPRQTENASTLTFNPERGTPVIPVQLGVESFNVLIDTGSDAALTLNPAGLHPRFASGPREGPPVASIAGDRPQLVGRLSQNFYIGTHTVVQPIADLTDQLSSLGGELLRHFALTFDQRRNLVTLVRPNDEDVRLPPRRSTGLSFSRSPAYWRVLSVLPDTPATQLPVQPGDLCVRINGELVAKWDFERYAALVRSAARITYTFLNGPTETDLEVPAFDLVP